MITLKSCAKIVGTEVIECDTEERLLLAWRRFVHDVDPDIITGYNIVIFDLPYLINRAQALKIPSYPTFGRLKDSLSKVKDSVFQSKALGTRDTKEISNDANRLMHILQTSKAECSSICSR